MGDDQLDQVKRLFALRQEGFLTEAEFQSEKRRLLGVPSEASFALDKGVEEPLELTESVAIEPMVPAMLERAELDDEEAPVARWQYEEVSYFKPFILISLLIAAATIGYFMITPAVDAPGNPTEVGQVQESKVESSHEDRDLHRWLVGTWAFGGTCDSDDGIDYFPDGRWETMYEKGTWRLDGFKLVETSTATREPPDAWEVFPEPKTQRLTILRKGGSSLEYSDEQGKRRVLVRCRTAEELSATQTMNPAVEPAAQTMNSAAEPSSKIEESAAYQCSVRAGFELRRKYGSNVSTETFFEEGRRCAELDQQTAEGDIELYATTVALCWGNGLEGRYVEPDFAPCKLVSAPHE